jgi:hypothetical protein
MQVPEPTEIVEVTGTRVRGACHIGGCTCKDVRIVSYRRAALFAFLAERSGETADRVVPVEAGWRIPSATPAEMDRPPATDGAPETGQPLEFVHTQAVA